MIRWHTFEDRADMVEALKAATVKALRSGLEAKGRASWAVSGGSTPAPLLAAMSAEPLDWSNIGVALVDERWVDSGHPRSNEAFVRRSLAKDRAAGVKISGMKTPHATAKDAEVMVNARYSLLALPFDSVLLGLGPDGHTASFFPGAEGLEEALDPACPKICSALRAVRSDVTGDEVERMSLTAATIKKARHVVMMITGTEKKAVLERAIERERQLPAARLAALKPYDVYWAP